MRAKCDTLESPVIFWFRRDLRLDDNIGLHQAVRSGKRVLPVFILDPKLQRGAWFSRNRRAFLLDALTALDSRLWQIGARLLVLEGDPLEALASVISETEASALYFNRDYTPFARARDLEVERSLGIAIHAFDDGLLITPQELRKNDGAPFKVYTAFRRRWISLEKPPISELGFRSQHFLNTPKLHALDLLRRARDRVQPQAPLPAADEIFGQKRLASYVSQAIGAYKSTRNDLAIDPVSQEPAAGPSFLSPFLRVGLLSPRQVYWAARDRCASSPDASFRQSIETFLGQIIWREFFMHIMFHFPRVRYGNFRREYDRVKWRRAPAELDAWQEGRTGYPIVDAAMRQLRAIGWMPNRARMFTASFLSKHLLIHWAAGEAHFMRHLLDGDPAANNGGWQWAAGTGTDAQPYFRIFNPVRQSKKFDKAGDYIRYWLPELRHLPERLIHEPWQLQSKSLDYPAPIVDHYEARERALSAFRAARNLR